MNNTLYREEILEHFKNPQNWGRVENEDFVMDDNNPLCGDNIHLTGRIDKDKIVEIKFKGEGCVISKASASIFTEYTKDKYIKEIKDLNQQDFLSLIEIPLTAARLKCALLPYSALQKALKKVG